MDLRGGRVLLTEILSPRIARQGAVCLIPIRGSARTARIEQFELDEAFQTYHPPFRNLDHLPRTGLHLTDIITLWSTGSIL